MFRKGITKEQFDELQPFNKQAHKVEELFGYSVKEYWFQIAIEVTRDCDTNTFATIEVHKR